MRWAAGLFLVVSLTGCATEADIEDRGNDVCVRKTANKAFGFMTYSTNEYVFRCSDGAIVAGNN